VVNRIRRENPALHRNESLRFHEVDNDQIIIYSKHVPDQSNILLIAVNLDPHHIQSGWTKLSLEPFGIGEHDTFQMHDLLTDERYLWQGPRNYIQLSPLTLPAHIFRLRRRVRSEQDFDYFA
jgi:starch synthase (maltosyl-transferring)